jgi:aspartate/methionine/tyrosine aminotransferase
MSDILLAKPKLPEGWLDTSVGEPHVVRDTLIKIFNLSGPHHIIPTADRMHEYPLPTGYQPLVDLLEKKHGAPVIITNGAKQALGSVFYALKKMGRGIMGMRTPFWALIPPLAKMHGLECVDEYDYSWDSYLSLIPNNPDNFSESLEDRQAYCKQRNIPLVHDGAYYTHTYLPFDYELKSFGDVQIYSISKMLGLSGLRLGYAVCSNPQFYRYIQEYMEAMTVGVSVMPQIFLEKLLLEMQARPDLTLKFEMESAMHLRIAKEIMMQVRPEVLDIPENLPDIPGMFLWAKVGPACNFQQAKINTIDGALFGVPGMVRMNLALPEDQMIEVVKRLNSVKG